MSKAKKDLTKYPIQRVPVQVHDNDVLSGRGVNIALHPGNQRFRTLITSRRDECYCTAYTASEKRAVALGIIKHIKELDPPGRFLKREGRGQSSRGLHGPWDVLTEKECVKKTCQALRDCNRWDRAGYADGVSVPEDVARETAVRFASGLSSKQQAAMAAAVAVKGHKRPHENSANNPNWNSSEQSSTVPESTASTLNIDINTHTKFSNQNTDNMSIGNMSPITSDIINTNVTNTFSPAMENAAKWLHKQCHNEDVNIDSRLMTRTMLQKNANLQANSLIINSNTNGNTTGGVAITTNNTNMNNNSNDNNTNGNPTMPLFFQQSMLPSPNPASGQNENSLPPQINNIPANGIFAAPTPAPLQDSHRGAIQLYGGSPSFINGNIPIGEHLSLPRAIPPALPVTTPKATNTAGSSVSVSNGLPISMPSNLTTGNFLMSETTINSIMNPFNQSKSVNNHNTLLPVPMTTNGHLIINNPNSKQEHTNHSQQFQGLFNQEQQNFKTGNYVMGMGVVEDNGGMGGNLLNLGNTGTNTGLNFGLSEGSQYSIGNINRL